MTLKEILLTKLNSLLNPKLESIVIRTFLFLGVFLVGIPSVPAINATISVKNGGSSFIAEINNKTDITLLIIGVICLVVAGYFYFRTINIDNKSGSIVEDITVTKDKKTISNILKSINTDALDQAIERGLFSQFYDPVLHYYYGVEGIAKSSSFNIYNKNLKASFNNFYNTFVAFVSHGQHFRETANRNIHRFIKAREVLNWEMRDEYESNYLSDVRAFSIAYITFMTYIKDNYPDINLEETNRIAFEDYKSYNTGSIG